MKLAVGIVGLPNVGKSTLFNALNSGQGKLAQVANYPFTTIEPNVGVVEVPDERLEKLAQVLKPQKKIPAAIEFIDIAGLVKNAYLGEGLGNQFLAKIREVAAVLQVVRAFEDENVAHVEGRVNPVSDIQTIQTELALKDLETLKKHLEKLQTQARGKKTDDLIFAQIQFWQKVEKELGKANLQRSVLSEIKEKQRWLQELHLLSFKPQIIVLNIQDTDLDKLSKRESSILKVQNELKNIFPGILIIPVCAKLEADLTTLSESEQSEYRQTLGLKTSGLEEIIKAAYQLLDLITFYTTQNQILQAWSIKKGSNALQAAELIHTDFAKGFIKAEVVPFERFLETGSFEKARAKGWVRLEGKDYLVQDGDAIYFRVKT